MIEMLCISHNRPASLQGSVSNVDGILAKALMPVSQQDITFTREDHMLKELSLIRSAMRSPRRSQTHQDYKIPAEPPQSPTVTTIQAAACGRPQEREIGQNDKGDSGSPECPSERPAEEQPRPSEEQAPRRRPRLGTPRRSYSVMDYEPLPHHHRPSSRLTLIDLPGELHMAIFDFLDPIDSTCFGLANKHFYAIHRRMHGSVPLSARRDGPNELEWAWHLAGTLVKAPPSVNSPAATTNVLGHHEHNALAKLRVRGQAYCRKCGITRCELYKHIKDWMGEGMEYCEVKQKFGPAAQEGARSFCYMSVPNNPHRCGRHRAQKAQIVPNEAPVAPEG